MIFTFFNRTALLLTLIGQLLVAEEECVELPLEEEGKATLILTIEKAVSIALTASRKLGSAYSAVEQAEINMETAATEFDLKILPKGDMGFVGGGPAKEGWTIGTGVEFYKKCIRGTRISFNPSFMKAAKDFRSNLRASIKQPLLRGFGVEYNLAPIRAAQYGKRTAYRNLYIAQSRLIMQTIQAMYDVARLEAIVELEKESVQRIKNFCASTRVKERIGMCNALDVYRAEIELKHAEEGLNQSLDRLQDAKDGVRDLLSLDWDQEIEITVPLEYEPVQVPIEEAIEVALTHRIEVDQARDHIQESRRLMRQAKDNLRPDLNLAVDYTSFAYDEMFTRSWSTKRESTWGFGLTTSSDLYKVNENAAYEQSIINSDEAMRNEEQLRENIILDVKRVIRTLARTEEKMAGQEEQILNSQKESRLAKLKFAHGLANNFDLIQSEKNLRAAQNGLISALIEHKITTFKLLAILGTLADKPGICL
jgi:outer membrane protein TolC